MQHTRRSLEKQTNHVITEWLVPPTGRTMCSFFYHSLLVPTPLRRDNSFHHYHTVPIDEININLIFDHTNYELNAYWGITNE